VPALCCFADRKISEHPKKIKKMAADAARRETNTTSGIPATLLTLSLLSLLCQATSLSVGVNIDPTNSNGGSPQPRDVNITGSSWVRIEFKALEPVTGDIPDSTFQFYDDIISNYVSSSLNVIVIIDYQTTGNVPWGSVDVNDWSSYSTDYNYRVDQIAQHYHDLGLSDKLAYEIWNEQDLEATYVPPSGYAVLLNAAYSTIKAIDGSASSVIMGGLASGNPGYVSDVITYSDNGLLNVDGIGLHPYGQRPSANWPNSDWGFGTVSDLMNNYHQVSTKPQWITEVGTNDESVQDDFPWHMFTTLESISYCPVALWFCWSDGMVPPFGLIDVDGNDKGSYYSFLNYTAY
jgi:hypothetical protein